VLFGLVSIGAVAGELEFVQVSIGINQEGQCSIDWKFIKGQVDGALKQ
jgi:hypothetical protein